MSIQALFQSQLDHLVAIETPDNTHAVLFQRSGDAVRKLERVFRPFILLTSPTLLNGFGGACFEIMELEGAGEFCYKAEFSDSDAYEDAGKFLKKATGFTPSSPNAPYTFPSDRVQQAMIQLQLRLFSGMEFNDVRRLQFDIETLCDPEYDFPNPKREKDAIVLISLSDNTGWETVLSARNRSEKELLEDFVRTVGERDPDILEGHNIFRFDLPYIEERAKRHKVKLLLGRDGSAPKKRNSRFNAAERTVNYTRYDIFGRHIADTYHLTVFYDIVARELDSYGLKAVARHFGLASEDRTYVDASRMNEEWESDPERAAKYCLDDVRETRGISNLLSPSYFYQTQIIPLSYQNAIIRGNATKIDSIFLAEYLRNHHAIPLPERGRPFAGALTRSFDDGVFDHVMHCDVRSLYPSIILSEKWTPARDELGVFPRFLKTLRTFRLEAKDAARNAEDPRKKDYFNSLQATFKILINSFYGYLGFEQGFLNDYDMAERVTTRGREILTSMLDSLNEFGAKTIEMDTDGIYFQPPQSVDIVRLQKEVQGRLPEGIDIDFDETYRSMFSYKSKNYALLHLDGSLSIRGAALKSRGLEPFQRDYMEQLIRCLLERDLDGVQRLYARYASAIRNRELPIGELAKSETLSDSLDTYKRKMSSDSPRRSAAYELAIRSGREYRQGDQVSFYITGDKKRVAVVDSAKLVSDFDPAHRDENVEYYLSKLDELAKKFEPFTGRLQKPSADAGIQPSFGF